MDLLSYIREKPVYQELYIEWSGIGYDKDKLVKLLKRIKLLKFLKFFSSYYKLEYENLVKVLSTYDKNKLNLLLNNDETYTRVAILEKYARDIIRK